ncbi:alpha/beta fold hydrolase [Actinocrispum wychmicini]|uniref:Pimeloyl-ACP methyl ester carboxylesterase n=1 Tax=Actinocrispum wychmicini TaxID=1213861 RepID=A0A4R2IHN0_9PSEU|nr:alpha/beta hydrolase [Actinocrispum wychmicini]TCO43772.1 pimeloyl-ACP methyl ester carboxylesterase [Actinocrispum wychmicini]
MNTATSLDGTPIAFDVTGEGPAVILIGGAFNDRTTVAGVAKELSPRFTAIAYDRRGRGGSGDTKPYSVAREIEDVAALIEYAGGSAHVFGHSSGAILALRAAAELSTIDKLAVYEPPFVLDNGLRAIPPADIADRVQALVDEGRRDDAVTTFMTDGGGVPAEQVKAMQSDSSWDWLVRLANTLPYDLAVCGPRNELPTDLFGKIAVPTLVMGGAASQKWLPTSARAVADAIPGARGLTLDGQDHGSVLQQPETLGEILLEFYA